MAWPFTAVLAAPTDTGFIQVTIAEQTPQAGEYWLAAMWITNDSDVEQWIRVTDGAGKPIIPKKPDPAAVLWACKLPFILKRTGLKIAAGDDVSIGFQAAYYLTA